MSDGVVSVVVPAGWTVERDNPWSSGIFADDMVAAVAHDEGVEMFSRPRAYVGHRDWGSLRDFAETLLSWEQNEMCLADDFAEILWQEAEVGELRGYRLRTKLLFEELPPAQVVEVLVVARAMTPSELVSGPMGDRLSGVVTRCPMDDPVNLSKVESLWASLSTHTPMA